MKYILRTFGLVSVNDVNTMLENEAKFWEDHRKNLTNPEDIQNENSKNTFSSYAEHSRSLKLSVYLLNKWW